MLLYRVARAIHTSFWLRHLFFLLATLTTIFILGYHFGTFDQSIHIPFLKQFADPTLYPNDSLVNLRYTHYSFFWYPFSWFLKRGLLEPSLFVVHVLSIYISFIGLWRLSMRLFGNALSAGFAVLLFVVPHVGFSGFSTFEFSLLNRTFILPFLFFIIEIYLSGKRYLAFYLLGLAYNIHALSGTFVLTMLGIDILLQFRSLRQCIVSFALFCFGAAPVLFWRFVLYPTSTVSIDRAWFSLVSNGALYHIFQPFGTYPHILLPALSGIAAFGALVYFLRTYPTRISSHRQTIRNFLFAIVMIFILNEVSVRFFPLTIVIQSQVTRSGVFLIVFFYLYIAHVLAKDWQKQAWSFVERLMFLGTAIIFPAPLFPALMLLAQRVLHRKIIRVIMSASLLIGSFMLTLFVIASWNVWSPEINIYGKNTPWKDIQVWAKNNTPRSALFLTPPYQWWFYESDWRVFSERSSLTTITELFEIAFTPEAAPDWKERYEDVVPGVYSKFRGNFFENLQWTKETYQRLTEQGIMSLKNKYHLSYVVVERSTAYPGFPIAYQNSDYVVYDLQSNSPVLPIVWEKSKVSPSQ